MVAVMAAADLAGVCAGRRKVLGNFNNAGKDAAEVAMTFISINVRHIRAWLSGQPPTDEPLQNRACDVVLAVGSLEISEQGSSAGVAQVCAHVPCCVCLGEQSGLSLLTAVVEAKWPRAASNQLTACGVL